MLHNEQLFRRSNSYGLLKTFHSIIAEVLKTGLKLHPSEHHRQNLVSNPSLDLQLLQLEMTLMSVQQAHLKLQEGLDLIPSHFHLV